MTNQQYNKFWISDMKLPSKRHAVCVSLVKQYRCHRIDSDRISTEFRRYLIRIPASDILSCIRFLVYFSERTQSCEKRLLHSSSPIVHMKQLVLHWMDFPENLYWGVLLKPEKTL